jgi:hypothetical protein
MNDQVGRVAAQAQDLSDTAERLERLVARFKTEAATVTVFPDQAPPLRRAA